MRRTSWLCDREKKNTLSRLPRVGSDYFFFFFSLQAGSHLVGSFFLKALNVDVVVVAVVEKGSELLLFFSPGKTLITRRRL